jgi:hypothetical protein
MALIVVQAKGIGDRFQQTAGDADRPSPLERAIPGDAQTCKRAELLDA